MLGLMLSDVMCTCIHSLGPGPSCLPHCMRAVWARLQLCCALPLARPAACDWMHAHVWKCACRLVSDGHTLSPHRICCRRSIDAPAADVVCFYAGVQLESQLESRLAASQSQPTAAEPTPTEPAATYSKPAATTPTPKARCDAHPTICYYFTLGWQLLRWS